MHTTTFNTVEDGEWTVHHNGDYSGDVKIIVPIYEGVDSRVELVDMSHVRDRVLNTPYLVYGERDVPLDYYEVNIPYDLLQKIVGSKIRSDMISHLESLTYDEVLRTLLKTRENPYLT